VGLINVSVLIGRVTIPSLSNVYCLQYTGWLKTFDGYYSAQVKNILDNMVLKLRQHERMKFIYAEISFFSTWWKSATEEQKESVKR